MPLSKYLAWNHLFSRDFSCRNSLTPFSAAPYESGGESNRYMRHHLFPIVRVQLLFAGRCSSNSKRKFNVRQKRLQLFAQCKRCNWNFRVLQPDWQSTLKNALEHNVKVLSLFAFKQMRITDFKLGEKTAYWCRPGIRSPPPFALGRVFRIFVYFFIDIIEVILL